MIAETLYWDYKAVENYKNLISKSRVHVKCSLGVTSLDMADCITPTVRCDTNVVLLHVGTNDLRLEMSSEKKKIAESIMDTATRMKSKENGDGFNKKARSVNEHLMNFVMIMIFVTWTIAIFV